MIMKIEVGDKIAVRALGEYPTYIGVVVGVTGDAVAVKYGNFFPRVRIFDLCTDSIAVLEKSNKKAEKNEKAIP